VRIMNVEVKYTYQDLLTTPEDNRRYEIFEGELVMSPAPDYGHQNAQANLFNILFSYIRKKGWGKVFAAPFDVYFDEETVVEPDILFISTERLHIIDGKKVNGAPDLVVELLSPSTESRDRGFKFKRYAEEGVKEYWMADAVQQTLEIYQLTPQGFTLFAKFSGNEEAKSKLLKDLKFGLREIWD